MFAVLHLDDFALQAVLRIEPDLAGRPVALLDETRRPPVVIAATAEARARGVDSGLTASQAMARCSAIVLRNAQPAAEADARAGLLAAAFSVSPHVEDTAPGVCTMEVGGLAGERRAPALRAALAQLRALGLNATAGLAATPLLARYAARWGATNAAMEGRARPPGAPKSPTGGPSGPALPGADTIDATEGSGSRWSPTSPSGLVGKPDENKTRVGRGVPAEPSSSESQRGVPAEPRSSEWERGPRLAEDGSPYLTDCSPSAEIIPSGPPVPSTSCHLIGDTIPSFAMEDCHLLGDTTPSEPMTGLKQCHLLGDTTSFAPLADCHLLGDTTRGAPSDRAKAAAAEGSASVPEALREIRPGAERAFLGPLPLGVAEPPPDIAAILASWGVHTLGELTALTKADVTQRLGPAGLALWERAAGEVTRPLHRIAPPQAFVAEIALEHEVETLEPLLFVLRRFIDRLALELCNAGFVAGEMTLGLALADDTAHTRSFRLPEPTAQEEILFRVLHTHLETLHTAASVRGLRLECHPTRPLARQHGLFDSALRDPYGFAETLGRVAAVAGADRVGTPVVENSHKPDAVTLIVPATVVPPAAEEGPHLPRGLPLRRYREPLSATVELSGEAPAFVWTPTISGAVRAVAGPWRGSGEWWDASRAWRREEWDVELAPGGLYRLLHTRDGWFVEGEYD